jgi:hypothetical protein
MRRVLVLAVLVAALAFPAAASADTIGGGYGEPPPAGSMNGMTIEVGPVTLTAKLVAKMNVVITCQPKPATGGGVYSWWDGGTLRAWVKQANGRSISFGYTDIWLNPEATCDGTPKLFPVTVSADPSSTPFKSGSAVVAVAGDADYGFENWGGGCCDEEAWDISGGYVQQRASTGWFEVRFRK